jgi:hypothetical protein
VRFELTQAGERAEFWVFDVDHRLEAALASLAWERSGTATGQNGWRRSFAVAAGRAQHAFDNTHRLLLPMLRQAADIDPVIWESALEEVCCRFGAAGLDWWLCGSAALSVRGAPADLPDVTDFGQTAAGRLETVRWRGWEIRVPPLDLQRAVCERRGLADRVAMIDALAVAT